MSHLSLASFSRALLVYGVMRAIAALPQLFVGLFAADRFWPADAVWVGVVVSVNAGVAVAAVFGARHLLGREDRPGASTMLLFVLAAADALVFVLLWVHGAPTVVRLTSLFLIFTLVDLFAGWTARALRSGQT